MKRFFKNNENTVVLEIGINEYTYNDIKLKARELELIFRQKFNSGECVLVSSENIFLYIASLFAFKKIGLVFCCWNGHAAAINELSSLVSASGYIKTSKSGSLSCHRAISQVVVDSYLGDFIITTSGSSGKPKGVLLQLENIIRNAKEAGKSINFNEFELEKWCIDIDFSLMSAISHLFMAWSVGIPLRSMREDASEQVRKSFQTHKIGFGGAPLQLSRLSQEVESFHNGCLLVSSGDFLNKEAVRKILDKHIRLSICTFYGLTELSGRFCYMTASDVCTKPGAAGKPILKGSLKISNNDTGEINTDSPYLYLGYFRGNGVFEKAPEIFETGDIASIDDDGYIWLKGRVNDTFKVSGEKVNRKKIEEVLYPLLNMYDFCILPVSHNVMGSCCALFVATGNRELKVSLREIVLAIREKLTSNCIPVYSYKLESLPCLDNGKLDKQFLIKNHDSFERYQ